ncbi:MAG TPA: CarD family transcriptional regulator, partial [Azospirillaceae bacterium]|nr:CarD family transcriptional regulator [Azospirillaceae bacterium]
MSTLDLQPGRPGRRLIGGAPEGHDARVLGNLARMAGKAGLLHVTQDDVRAARLIDALRFFAPDVEVVSFPAWDCLPYDRVSPNGEIVGARIDALTRLLVPAAKPRLVVTTINAVLQRVPPRASLAGASFRARSGDRVDVDALQRFLAHSGYMRAQTVREPGEYAVRGGIIDLYPAGLPNPVRLDFFGDALESIRSFDPESQRTVGTLRSLDLVPMSEVQLTTESIKRFRQAYVATFGAPTRDDRLYEAISEGRRYPGLEHWLPLFHDHLDTLLDYVPGIPVVFDALADDAAAERLAQVKDYYDARRENMGQNQPGVAPYRPLSPDQLYVRPEEWSERANALPLARLTPFAVPEAGAPRIVVDCGARQGRNFIAERADENANVFEAVIRHIRDQQAQGRRVILGAWSDGSRERLCHVLQDHDLRQTKPIGRFSEAMAYPRNEIPVGIWPLEHGFETADLTVVSEQDILGDRLVRQKRKSRRPQDFLTEVAALTPGDLVVHVDHGIGRFEGLKTIEAAGAPHDCLELHYAGGDRLFLPVEN